MDNRIYRSRNTKMLGGVCGGLADMFNMDPTLVRLIAVALTFLTGFTFLLVYILCAVIIPLEPSPGYILRRHQQPVDPGYPPTVTPSSEPVSQEKDETVGDERQSMATPEENKTEPQAEEPLKQSYDTVPVSDEASNGETDASQMNNDETTVNSAADRY